MNESLRLFLLWTGIALAMLAAWVTAPEALGRIVQNVREVAARYLPFLRPRSRLRVTGLYVPGSWSVAASVYLDRWKPTDTMDRQFQALHEEVVELRETVATREKAIREEITRQIDKVTTNLDVVRTDVANLESAFRAAEERSGDLDARGLLPIGFGILLSGAPAELATVPGLGWPLAVIGVVFVVGCVVILVKHYRLTWRRWRARRRAAATTSGTS